MWFIGVEVEQETSAPPPKKNPGSAPGPQPNKTNNDPNSEQQSFEPTRTYQIRGSKEVLANRNTIVLFLFPSNFCIRIVFNFSWGEIEQCLYRILEGQLIVLWYL